MSIQGTSEFIQHFNRCVDHIRWKEVQADLASVNGRPSMQTCFQQLERSAANVYTLSVFYMFQPILVRAVSTKVINMRQTGSYVIYSVGLDRTPNEIWRVFCCDIEMEFKCSCLRMESFGIPCEHILCVLVHEDIKELPRSLVLPRWTKTAKVDLQNSEEDAAQKELVNDADSVRDDVYMMRVLRIVAMKCCNKVVIAKKSSHSWQRLEIHPKKWSGGVKGSFGSGSKSIQEDGKVLPEFEDAEERQLFEALMLELDNNTSVDFLPFY
ncbi:Protein FAR1-RELATED SEQUENCE [Arachis hypogaea]|nr:Protein FAR1-RELATED SEQUENCE [Arachis hypogaea]